MKIEVVCIAQCGREHGSSATLRGDSVQKSLVNLGELFHFRVTQFFICKMGITIECPHRVIRVCLGP